MGGERAGLRTGKRPQATPRNPGPGRRGGAHIRKGFRCRCRVPRPALRLGHLHGKRRGELALEITCYMAFDKVSVWSCTSNMFIFRSPLFYGAVVLFVRLFVRVLVLRGGFPPLLVVFIVVGVPGIKLNAMIFLLFVRVG